MFTPDKSQSQIGNQLIDNTNTAASQTENDGITGNIYTMPNIEQANGSKSSKTNTSPKIILAIAGIVIIAIIVVGFWFYSTIKVPADDLLIDSAFNSGSLILPNNIPNKDEENIKDDQDTISPKARDQQRLDDISGVRSALAFYYQEMKAYPDIMDDLLDKYLDSIPINPNPGGNSYIYIPQNNNQSYKLTFTLENGGKLGVLTLQAGEYQASPILIEPFIDGKIEKENTGDDGSNIELLSGLDSDSDGLTDIEENLYNTSSTLVDSDEDGYSDASELINLYDPSQIGVLLADADTVTQYINTTYNYSILYPSEWTVRALTKDKMEVIFNSKTTEFVQILVLENPLGLSARNWYLNYNKDVTADDLTEIVLNNIVGITIINNGRYTYLGVGSNIYSIIYNIGITNQLNYQATYEMMLNSWELVTIDEGLPAGNRDTQRFKDIIDIRFALLEYQVANLSLLEEIDNDVDTYQMIGVGAGDCAMTCGSIFTTTQCIDLSKVLVPDYLMTIPYDPLNGNDENSGYYLNLLTDGMLVVGACSSEIEEKIEVNN